MVTDVQTIELEPEQNLDDLVDNDYLHRLNQYSASSEPLSTDEYLELYNTKRKAARDLKLPLAIAGNTLDYTVQWLASQGIPRLAEKLTKEINNRTRIKVNPDYFTPLILIPSLIYAGPRLVVGTAQLVERLIYPEKYKLLNSGKNEY